MMAETGNNRVQGWRPAATLLAVAVAYYVGAQLGFILRFPPTTPSVLWPPNSILTAALLLTPVPDAGLVTSVQGACCSFVSRTRFFSNVLASLTILPAVVMAVRNGLPNLRAAAPHRHLEARLLASGLFLASMGQFGNPSEFGLGLPAELSAPVAVLLPFLLWSAVRFGPGGLSVCLVATALLAVVAGTGER